jgi:hypothetical protein
LEKRISISQFLRVITQLPYDEPRVEQTGRKRSQQEHWLGWLSEYNTKGYYGRKPGMNRDAKFAYNHVVCPDLLIYLIRNAGFDPKTVEEAEKVFCSNATYMEKVGKIRKIVPWSMMYFALWGDENHPGKFNPDDITLWERIKKKIIFST